MINYKIIVKTSFATLLMLLSILAASSTLANNSDPDRLKVALLPDENAATIIQNNQPLTDYLADTLSKEIELIVTTDYSSMIEAMRFGRIDIAYFGPVSYTIAKDKMNGADIDIEPFAVRVTEGSSTYQSVIIANSESGIETYDDIKGKDIDLAFGDPASTSSHFAPKYTLMNAGVKPSDYNEQFLGAHDAVVANVVQGQAAVGGLSRPIFETLIEKGAIKLEYVNILGYSDPLPQYPWVMRTNLSESLRSAIASAFIDLDKNSEAHRAVLKPLKSDGFKKATDGDYDIIRSIRTSIPQ